MLRCAVRCSGISESMFVDSMYNWAATLTQSGANYPFSLPLKTDKLPSGFNVREACAAI